MVDTIAKVDRQMLEAFPFMQIVFALDLRILEVNARHCAMTGRRREDVIGLMAFEAFPGNPDDPSADAEGPIRQSIARVVETGEVDEMDVVKHDVQDAGGAYTERYWQITHTPIFTDPATRTGVVAVLQTARDVTRTELENRMMAARVRTASIRPDVAEFLYDPTSHTIDSSPHLQRLFGFEPVQRSGDATPIFERIHRDDLGRVQAEIDRILAAPLGEGGRFDYRIVQPDGQFRWVTADAEFVLDPVTQGRHLVGVVIDITRYKQTEKDLMAALGMRDLLMAEVNHRVKNSLQLVSSVLSLEARSAGSDAVRQALGTATSRINAISMIHGALYKGDDVRSTRIDDHLRDFCAELEQTGSSADRRIVVRVDADPITLEVDKAINLSLAVNELVTNSYKHAFEGRGEGRITVSLRDLGDDLLRLEVSDDGVRHDAGATVPPASPADRQSGLGTRLVAGLVGQLGGTIAQSAGPAGWTTRIDFPRGSPAAPSRG